jgi:hypothetical protein
MRFMVMVKHAENQGRPPQALMDAIGELVEGAMKSGKMLGAGGLLPSSAGALVRLSGGRITTTDGPFTEAKEVIGGYAQFEFESKQEAIKAGVEFMELHKKLWPGWEGVSEIRQMEPTP